MYLRMQGIVRAVHALTLLSAHWPQASGTQPARARSSRCKFACSVDTPSQLDLTVPRAFAPQMQAAQLTAVLLPRTLGLAAAGMAASPADADLLAAGATCLLCSCMAPLPSMVLTAGGSRDCRPMNMGRHIESRQPSHVRGRHALLLHSTLAPRTCMC